VRSTLLLLAVGCILAGAAARASTHGDSALPRIVVTRDAAAVPRSCAPGRVARELARFVLAFNAGDRRRLDRSFTHAGYARTAFQWYSIVEGDPARGGRSLVVRERRRLLDFLLRRHRHGERLVLRTVEVGRSWVTGSGAFTFTLLRQADDLLPNAGGADRLAQGKGEIVCATGRIWVWSAEMPALRGHAPLRFYGRCPKPRGWRPLRGPIVACVPA
jgi:hypothetical protein